MSTRSRIGMVQEDGTVKSIYCHHDGYLAHNGDILLNHYNTQEKVEELIGLGSLSALGPRIIPDEHNSWRGGPEDVCVPHTLRGDEVSVDRDPSVNTFKTYAFCSGEEYAYLFRDGKWSYARSHGNTKRFLTLTQKKVDNDKNR